MTDELHEANICTLSKQERLKKFKGRVRKEVFPNLQANISSGREVLGVHRLPRFGRVCNHFKKRYNRESSFHSTSDESASRWRRWKGKNSGKSIERKLCEMTMTIWIPPIRKQVSTKGILTQVYSCDYFWSTMAVGRKSMRREA